MPRNYSFGSTVLQERICLNRENYKEKMDTSLTGIAFAHGWDLALFTFFN